MALTIRTIASGGIAFEGENITFSGIGTANNLEVGSLNVLYPIEVTATDDNPVTVYDADGLPTSNTTGEFTYIALTKDALEGKYGVYTTGGSSPVTIFISKPHISVSIDTPNSGGCKISKQDGGVPKFLQNSDVNVIVSAPRVATGITNTKVMLVFTTPSGGKNYKFGYDTIDTSIPETFENWVLEKLPQNVRKVHLKEDYSGTMSVKAYITYPDLECVYESEPFKFEIVGGSHPRELKVHVDKITGRSPFLVHIEGDPGKAYAVKVIAPSLKMRNSGVEIGSEEYMELIKAGELIEPPAPTPREGQPGDTLKVSVDAPTKTGYSGFPVFTLKNDGTRSIEYVIGPDVSLVNYTVIVYEPTINGDGQYEVSSTSKFATDTSETTKGKMTVCTNHFNVTRGDTIRITGCNTDSKQTFLFIDGDNLETGYSLPETLNGERIDASKNTKFVNVDENNGWYFDWNTSKTRYDNGTFQIYATSVLTNGEDDTEVEVIDPVTGAKRRAVALEDSAYAIVEISYTKPPKLAGLYDFEYDIDTDTSVIKQKLSPEPRTDKYVVGNRIRRRR